MTTLLSLELASVGPHLQDVLFTAHHPALSAVVVYSTYVQMELPSWEAIHT